MWQDFLDVVLNERLLSWFPIGCGQLSVKWCLLSDFIGLEVACPSTLAHKSALAPNVCAPVGTSASASMEVSKLSKLSTVTSFVCMSRKVGHRDHASDGRRHGAKLSGQVGVN